MFTIQPETILRLSGVVLYLAILLVSLGQRGLQNRLARSMAAFFGVSVLVELVKLAVAWNLVRVFPALFFENLTFYGLVFQSFFLFQISELFFRRRTRWFRWVLLGMAVAAGLILEMTQISTPYMIRLGSRWMVPGWLVTQVVLTGGWGYFMLRTVARTIETYRQEELLVTRTRIRYWSMALILILSGDLLILGGENLVGGWLKIVAGLLVSFVVLNTRLPDLRGALKFSVSTMVAATLELVLYATGFILLFAYSDRIIGYDPLLVSVALGVVLLILFNPINRVIKKGVSRMFYGVERDYNQVLRDYSKKISNVLDLDLLSKIMVELIGEWIDVDRGTLLTVDSDVDEETRRGYRLVGVEEKDGQKGPAVFLPSDSPITLTFHDEKKALTISEIEMLPKYHQIDGGVRIWFKSQKMDVFVPIFGMDEWIGILALGPKRSGSSYTRADFRLLETLADQTSVALQNARLVESIVRVNHEFRRAYAAMEEAHTKLERLDRTKSDFISIASHELRTPLTVLSGYSQMLMEDPKINESDYYRKMVKGIMDGTFRLHEIVDNMLEIAKIDTRVLELQSEPISMTGLIHQVSIGFKGVIAERKLSLSFDKLEELPPVLGDPEALKKVFYHLISNAIKYTPDGGAIVVSGSVLPEGDPRFPNGGIEMKVSDTGIGIDPRFKDLIFTKFYQTGDVSLHSSGKTKFKGGGPGLGLAIVRGIVQAHGGRVWAESPGSDEENPPGSEFHVILPTNAGEE